MFRWQTSSTAYRHSPGGGRKIRGLESHPRCNTCLTNSKISPQVLFMNIHCEQCRRTMASACFLRSFEAIFFYCARLRRREARGQVLRLMLESTFFSFSRRASQTRKFRGVLLLFLWTRIKSYNDPFMFLTLTSRFDTEKLVDGQEKKLMDGDWRLPPAWNDCDNKA